MRQHPKALIYAYALLGLSLCQAARALVPEPDHYRAIPDRNLFGLRPPQLATNEPPPPQLTKILLTGITTILGDKRALMKTLMPAGKPGEQAKEQSLILSEGQREGEIEVLAIDEHAGSVKVDNSGTIMTLTFDKDGAKLPSAPPSPSGLAGLPAPTNGQPLRGMVQPNPAWGPAHGNSRIRTFPTRNLRTSPPQEIGPSPETAGQAPGSPTGAPSGQAPAQSLPQDLTPEEQAIIQEFQRQANEQNTFPPVPSGVPIPAGSTSQPAASETTPPVLPQ